MQGDSHATETGVYTEASGCMGSQLPSVDSVPGASGASWNLAPSWLPTAHISTAGTAETCYCFPSARFSGESQRGDGPCPGPTEPGPPGPRPLPSPGSWDGMAERREKHPWYLELLGGAGCAGPWC